MAAGKFTITELRDIGDPATADDLARFEWTADSTPTAPFDGQKGGGARACPIKPWGIAGAQRTVRTDYPNAKIPGVQVLGPVLKPHLFKGRFDDRYNGAGFAKFEWRRFVDMAERGPVVRVQYGDMAYEGMVTDWNFDVQREWDIDYEITIDVYNRPDQSDRTRVPVTPNDPITALNDHDLAVQATLDADERAPRNAMIGTLADDVSTSLVGMVASRESLAATVDQRDVAPPENPVDAFTRIATQFRAAKDAASNLIERLGSVRADLDMAQRTAIGVLDFEDWSRSLRFTARISMGSAMAGSASATEHAEPSAVRLYRPSAGEHLYGIARKFYGVPHAWRLIYERNALRTFVMNGNETLLIPERGGV